MKKVVEILPLLTICFLYFGFINLYYYYQVFNIEIYSYISPTDILVSFLPNVVVMAALLSGFSIQIIFRHIEEENKVSPQLKASAKIINEKKINWWKKNAGKIIITFWAAYMVIIITCQYFFKLKSYELLPYEIPCDFILLVLIWGSFVIQNKLALIIERPIIALIIVTFIGIRLGHYSSVNGYKTKDGKVIHKKDQLKFNYKGQAQTTSDSVIFIGKTATYLFLYRMKDSSSMVYPLAQVDDLIIK